LRRRVTDAGVEKGAKFGSLTLAHPLRRRVTDASVGNGGKASRHPLSEFPKCGPNRLSIEVREPPRDFSPQMVISVGTVARDGPQAQRVLTTACHTLRIFEKREVRLSSYWLCGALGYRPRNKILNRCIIPCLCWPNEREQVRT